MVYLSEQQERFHQPYLREGVGKALETMDKLVCLEEATRITTVLQVHLPNWFWLLDALFVVLLDPLIPGRLLVFVSGIWEWNDIHYDILCTAHCIFCTQEKVNPNLSLAPNAEIWDRELRLNHSCNTSLSQTLWVPGLRGTRLLKQMGKRVGWNDNQTHAREVLNLNVMFWLSFRLILQRIIRGYKSQKDKIHWNSPVTAERNLQGLIKCLH